MFIGGVNLSGNSNSAPPPPAPARGYLEPIPFHLAQFSTPVHPGGSSGLLTPWPAAFAKRNDSITKVHTAVTGTLIADCGRNTLLFVRRYIQVIKLSATFYSLSRFV